MRYTEVRMTKLAHELLADLEKDTVDWEDNYDGSERIPEVLPTRVPNLLINGAAGIAVGMATNMAPHNMTEVVNACLAYADNPNISIEGLMEYITGPDFLQAVLFTVNQVLLMPTVPVKVVYTFVVNTISKKMKRQVVQPSSLLKFHIK